MYFQALPRRQETRENFRRAGIAELPLRVGWIFQQGVTGDADSACRRGKPTHHAIEQGTLAAAIRTHQHKPVAGLNRESDLFDDHTRSIPRLKATDLKVKAVHHLPFVIRWIAPRLPPTPTHELNIIRRAPC